MSDAHKLEGYPKGIIKLGFFFVFISLILATAQLEFLIFQTIFNILLSKLHLNLQITLHYLHGHQKCMESKYFLNYKPRELGFC